MKCKLTNKEIMPFMSFGKMPLANGFLSENDFGSEYFYEMEVGFSEKLSLFQLNDHPQPKKMFNKKYPFYTGSSEFMKLHFKKYAEWLKKYFLNSNSNLIEINIVFVFISGDPISSTRRIPRGRDRTFSTQRSL